VAALLDVSSSSSSSSSSGGGGAALPPAASATWSGHTMALTHLAFAPLSGLCGGPAAARLVTCSLDRTVRWWDVASTRCLRTVTLPTGATALAVRTPRRYFV
jgi:WD40 repeat protein